MPVDAGIRKIVAIREVVAGAAAVVVVAFACRVLVPYGDPAACVVVMAAVVGVMSAVLSDWRACLGVAAVSLTVFVGFVADGSGVDPLPFTPLIALAAMLGCGYRRMTAATGRHPPR